MRELAQGERFRRVTQKGITYRIYPPYSAFLRSPHLFAFRLEVLLVFYNLPRQIVALDGEDS